MSDRPKSVPALSTNTPQRNASVDFEERDWNLKWVLAFCVGLVLMMVAVHLTTIGLLHHWTQQSVFKGVYAPSTFQNLPVPPAPRQQTYPLGDLQQWRQQEDQLLHQAAWINPQQGTVRVPIDQAMQVLLQHGFKTEKQVAHE